MSIFKKYFNPIALITVLAMNAFISGCSGGGSTVSMPVGATSTAITEYSIGGATGIIDEASKNIAITLPYGTDVTALVATFTTEGATVKVGSTVQTSGVTPNDFTAPVIYTVTAGDASTANYTVTVTVASITAKAITAYSINGIVGTINETAKTIAVTLPNGTNVTALIAKFNTTGSSVKVGSTVQTSGSTANNFAAPVIYTVTAGDASTANYTVTVTVASITAKAITAYSFAGYPGATGVINEGAKTIAVMVPSTTNVTALKATFVTTGASVKVNGLTQVSGTTPNNFTSPVAYVVTAADNTSATYTVTVTKAASAAKAITAYSFAGQPDSVGVINETAKTIAVSVLPGTDLTSRIATFSTTGTSVKVNGVTQVSGTTSNNFTSSVAYTVTDANALTEVYSVTVTQGSGPIPVDLGTAENFTILTKAGITDVPTSAITGNIGTSPITGAAIGVTCSEVTGLVYTVDAAYADPSCNPVSLASKTLVDTAVLDMGTAYSAAAAARIPTNSELVLGSTPLTPNTYKWGGAVAIATDLTLNGGVNDVWIFQIGGTLDIAPGTQILLTGGAQAKNIFWQVAGVVTLNTTSHFEGIILGASTISMLNGASINGRLLGNTDVTLQSNAITQP